MRSVKTGAFLLSLALVALALAAAAVGLRQTTCPAASGPFSCAAIVRPSVSALGPVPVVAVLLVGAATQALAAGLLLGRGAKLPFARDAAALAAAGAGFAVGLQPLGLLATGRACLLCLAVVLGQLLLAGALARVAREAGAARRGLALAFVTALLVTGAFAFFRGGALRDRDARVRASLEAARRADGRLLLVTREGCPYCEAVLLDVLGDPAVLPRVERAGLRLAAPGTPEAQGELEAPVLRGGGVRAVGFVPDVAEYEPVLLAVEKEKR